MPGEVASVVVFLASDDARAVNGAEMRVDNGVLGMGL
jgi:3(or 17)beta-hydroxysteroid dehydrogenase